MNEQAIRDVLKTVLDPELGINIVDLGLIYLIQINDNQVKIRMTMTTPTCPLAGMIMDNVVAAVKKAHPQAYVAVELVNDPPWSHEKMSADAKAALGWKK